MTINYKINALISVEQFQTLLQATSLGARRPVDDLECLTGMLANSNLTVSAWHNDKLVGIARSMTDFHYACYLSDLAIHENYQKSGIGKKLQALTQEQLGPRCSIILLAAPAAADYYRPLGYEYHPRAWLLPRTSKIICS